jgi:quercetin dioxygenase-like cupin family protein
MNHSHKFNAARLLCLCGLSAVAMTANARTVERLADGTIRFLTRFNGPADVYLDKITLEPSEFVPFHYHPGDAITIVSQGKLTLRNRCRPDQHFSAGQAFIEVADVVHQVGNEGTEPVVFYGTIVGPGLGPVAFVDPPNCAISASLQPSILGFGDQTMLTSRTRRLTLRNTGTVALPIVSVDVSGRDEGAFPSADDCGTSVPAGASCHVSITFSPKALGDKSAKLRVETGDHIVFTRDLTGRGVRAR